MNPDTWKLVASIGGVLLTVVTGPIIWAIRAESGKIRAELRGEIRDGDAKLGAEIAKLGAEITAVDSRLSPELKLLRSEIKLDMTEMEKRLNERIDTRLVHR